MPTRRPLHFLSYFAQTAVGAAMLDVISHLHTMTDQLGTVGQRLDHMDGSMTAMAGSLQKTNADLSQIAFSPAIWRNSTAI
jgi:hypothetical protein